MQTWQTPLVTLKAGANDVNDGTVDLECSEVRMQANDVAEAGNAVPAKGDMLVVNGADLAPLDGISWAPSVISFSAVGATEPQQFKISGMKSNPASRQVSFVVG